MFVFHQIKVKKFDRIVRAAFTSFIHLYRPPTDLYLIHDIWEIFIFKEKKKETKTTHTQIV